MAAGLTPALKAAWIRFACPAGTSIVGPDVFLARGEAALRVCVRSGGFASPRNSDGKRPRRRASLFTARSSTSSWPSSKWPSAPGRSSGRTTCRRSRASALAAEAVDRDGGVDAAYPRANRSGVLPFRRSLGMRQRCRIARDLAMLWDNCLRAVGNNAGG